MNQVSGDAEANCPICGRALEKGYVFAPRGVFLQWISSEPTWWKSFKAFFSIGELIGNYALLTCTHADGKLCRSCRKIFLDLPENMKEKYFPDVKE